MFNELARRGFQVVFRTRRSLRNEVRVFLSRFENAKILELGSGKPVGGRYPYSCADMAPPGNKVVLSDINPAFGHVVVDVLAMSYKDEFDAILCCNLLEHVYETNRAIAQLYEALKPGGRLFISVPFLFPLHDEPSDYWRFTEHAFRRLLAAFVDVEVRYRGARRAPLAYYVTARKP